MGRDNGGSAFPGSDLTEGNTIRVWQRGMSLRDWFAGHAPELPPTGLMVSVSSKRAGQRPELQKLVDNWREDPYYDLDDKETVRPFAGDDLTEEEFVALCEYQKVWKAHWSDLTAWSRVDTESRYFQWRWYYADTMLKERKK